MPNLEDDIDPADLVGRPHIDVMKEGTEEAAELLESKGFRIISRDDSKGVIILTRKQGEKITFTALAGNIKLDTEYGNDSDYKPLMDEVCKILNQDGRFPGF